jgi:hypothetical protein
MARAPLKFQGRDYIKSTHCIPHHIDSGTLAPWNPGTAHPGTLAPWNHATGHHGHPGTRQTGHHATGHPGTRQTGQPGAGLSAESDSLSAHAPDGHDGGHFARRNQELA